MNSLKLKILAVIVGAAAIVAINSVYVVSQTKMALVLEFGKPVRVVHEPGLRFKAPFVQNVIFFDNRLLGVTVDQKEVIASDRKRLVVDAYVRYRITDPLKFYQTVTDERIMENRLGSIVESSLRQVLGGVPLIAVTSSERTNIMKKITEIVNAQTKGLSRPAPYVLPKNFLVPEQVENADEETQKTEAPAEAETPAAEAPPADAPPAKAEAEKQQIPTGGFGVEVVDVRIMRADLPPENSKAIFRRMQTEREREAKEHRAKGEEEAQGIRSRADRSRTEILADAQKKSETIRGEGDGEAIKTFAGAFGRDPQFFSFYRSMQAYKKSISKDDTTVVLSPDSEFLKYMQNP